ncbi:MAG: hypothetical protein WA632_02395, partial [Gallionella sp.]
LYEFPGGHIGVFVGSRSQKELAPAIAKWLVERDVGSEKKPAPASSAKSAAKAKAAKASAKKGK